MEFEQYLATEVLAKEKQVTYRMLSRALKVHVNQAKQMLFEYHKLQNRRKPNSVHATYLVYGAKHEISLNGDSDSGSGFALSLVPENKLEDSFANYRSIAAIHVYSLAAHPTKDFPFLSEPGALNKDGNNTIVNLNVVRRDPQGYQRPVTESKASLTAQSSAKTAIPSKSSGTLQPRPPVLDSNVKKSGVEPKLKTVTNPQRGGIMSSFAKAATKSQKPQKPSEPAADVKVEKMSEDEEDEDNSEFLPRPKISDASAAGRKALAQREAALKKMMDEEMDEDDEESPAATADIEQEDADESPVDAPASRPMGDEPSEVLTSVSDGRKRGRRRVMKPKRVQDDEGYLVTVMETAWESFSEDEAPLPKPAAAPAPVPSSSTSSKGKKPAPKGQGNIMSFFQKKLK